MVYNIDFKQLQKIARENKDVLLLDVRDRSDYEEKNIKGSINIPIRDLYYDINKIINYKNSIVIVYCYHGHRSLTACAILEELGFKKIYNLKKGIDIEIF